MKKISSALTLLFTGGVLFLGAALGLFLPDREYSAAERRRLAELPALSADSVGSGSFMDGAETYLQDQFPFREAFRQIKSLVATEVFGQKDVHGIYVAEGYAAKLDYPLDTASVDYAAGRFGAVYETLLKDSGCRVWLSVIPDKNQFLAPENGYPCLDFTKLVSRFSGQMPYASLIDISPYLELSDYYRTDIHWRQERLADVAAALAEAMGTKLSGTYRQKAAADSFSGVYRGQSALPMETEKLNFLEADYLEHCRVYDYETDREIPVYDLSAAKSADPYGMFLGGSKALLRLENPAAPEDKRLILFRDSFGSSIAPLLAEGYREIILADIRYITPAALGELVDFEGRDVLFLYSEAVLNNSETIK